MMDHASRALLDDLDEGLSVVEVEFLDEEDSLRVRIGEYRGLHKSTLGNWYLKIRKQFAVRMDDVVSVRKLKQTEA